VFINAAPNPMSHSTGKERDAETGLDYFGFRYYSGAQGRWTSPDEPFADQHSQNPQRWNLYGDVLAPADAERMFSKTGVDGVMLARGRSEQSLTDPPVLGSSLREYGQTNKPA
jgi:RHS repeat-associated protein